MTPGIFLALVAILVPAQQQIPTQAKLDLSPIVNKFAEDLKQKHKEIIEPKVFVADISADNGKVTIGGEHLADELALALGEKLGAGKVLDTKSFRNTLWQRDISPGVMLDNGVAESLALQRGANLIVVGRFKESQGKWTLHAELVRLSDDKHLSKTELEIALPPDWKEEMHAPLQLPANLEVAVPCGWWSNELSKQGFLAPGVTSPKAIKMNNPSFTDEARKMKLQGTVRFALTLDENGIPKTATLLKGLPGGLNKQSIDTAMQWRFHPVLKDGKPVPVCVVMEVTFALY